MVDDAEEYVKVYYGTRRLLIANCCYNILDSRIQRLVAHMNNEYGLRVHWLAGWLNACFTFGLCVSLSQSQSLIHLLAAGVNYISKRRKIRGLQPEIPAFAASCGCWWLSFLAPVESQQVHYGSSSYRIVVAARNGFILGAVCDPRKVQRRFT